MKEEKNLTHFVVYDIISNDLFISSPYTSVRTSALSFASGNEFGTSMEVPVSTIIFIFKTLHHSRSHRLLADVTCLELCDEVGGEDTTYAKCIINNLKMNFTMITKDQSHKKILAGLKYYQVLAVFERFLSSSSTFCWPRSTSEDSFFRNLKDQTSLKHIMLELVLKHQL